MAAPADVAGYVDPYAIGNQNYSSIYTDILEHVPDLLFPQSVQTFARMRRDPQVAAIIQSWTLQLRRAQWQLDPAGCRDEVARLVADDLGLQVVGDDKPGAARLRGVSWNDHLAAALRMLVFGFAGFEMQADTTTGQARLSGLWERPQWTVNHLHVDGKTGLLGGITQAAAWKQGAPEITADRLVWYANEREGSNWAGTSLIRPAYASWLIKEEMRRVHAVSNKRWGAGVPVMEALPGTNPSPGQMTEAMQLAAAAQAGMQAGAATPPGFTLKIQGLSGSVPDTLGFIKWLDQQMSRACLMGVLDLGDTANGSRALGDTFMDAFLLALEATAEAVADVATRQICARIVEWNYGNDEPVPRVVASGVGSRREVTAESLSLLLGAGALAADPALEAWVRREYRLPDRDKDSLLEVKVPKGDFMVVPGTGGDGTPTGPPVPAAPATTPTAPAPQPVQAARARAGRRRPNQPPLFGDDPDPERGHQHIQQQWVDAKAKLLKRWPRTAKPMVDELAEQAKRAASYGDPSLLGHLAVSAGVVTAVAMMLHGHGTDLAQQAAAGVVEEAAAQGVTAGVPPDAGTDRVRQTAEAVASIIAAGYTSGAARTALQLAGASPNAVGQAVTAHLRDLGASQTGLIGDNAGALLSAAQFAGRLAVLTETPATSYVAVERNDSNCCAACKSAAGTIYRSLDAALADYGGGMYRGCAGGLRCRGYIAPAF